jgi:hypothetical protein
VIEKGRLKQSSVCGRKNVIAERMEAYASHHKLYREKWNIRRAAIERKSILAFIHFKKPTPTETTRPTRDLLAVRNTAARAQLPFTGESNRRVSLSFRQLQLSKNGTSLFVTNKLRNKQRIERTSLSSCALALALVFLLERTSLSSCALANKQWPH